MTHIIDKIRNRRKRKLKTPFYSFEFFPPKTEAGVENLLHRIERMVSALDPLFLSVTFAPQSYHSSLEIASFAQRFLGVDVCLHVTCQGMSMREMKLVLNQAKQAGIHNLLVLRGDPPVGQSRWFKDQTVTTADNVDSGFPRAIDLVRWIRAEYGDTFCLAVAGHPEGHSVFAASISPSSSPSTSSSSSSLSSHSAAINNSPLSSREEELQHLKDKVNAGADLILTQFFYDVHVFLDFCQACQNIGIDCPILPGILPIQTFTSLTRMSHFCGVTVPTKVMEEVSALQTNDEQVKDYGIDYATIMCHTIFQQQEAAGTVAEGGIHFYTLNLERSVTRILINLGTQEDPTSLTTRRSLPWRRSALTQRSKEEQVRPINWANRPKSYVMRTETWDEFPNGRWGDSTSPAFGELSTVSHFYSVSLGVNDDEQRSVLGRNPQSKEDIYEVFAKYVEGRIPFIPWCETPLQTETTLIQAQLARLNRSGFLTINSQPAVNGASSSHPTFGWGGPDGFIYQKAYCECFCSPTHLTRLVQMAKRHSNMNLYAIQKEERRSCENNNAASKLICEGASITDFFDKDGHCVNVTALTWGVFPCREIVQPTVFDVSTFCVWAEEAFSLWTTFWQRLYEAESQSYKLIESIRDSFYLCAIVDNDYVSTTTSCDGYSSLWKAMLDS